MGTAFFSRDDDGRWHDDILTPSSYGASRTPSLAFAIRERGMAAQIG